MKITVKVDTVRKVFTHELAVLNLKLPDIREAARGHYSNVENTWREVGPWWNRKRAPLGEKEVRTKLAEIAKGGNYVSSCMDVVTFAWTWEQIRGLEARIGACVTMQRWSIKEVTIDGPEAVEFLRYAKSAPL